MSIHSVLTVITVGYAPRALQVNGGHCVHCGGRMLLRILLDHPPSLVPVDAD